MSKGNSDNPKPLDKLFENLDFTPTKNHAIIDIGKNLIYCKGGEKVVNEMGQTDKQYDGYLIDEYAMLKQLKETAEKENAVETVKAIDSEMNIIKLKLQPTELPE